MLVRLGVRPGDRVGILLPNVPEFLSTINGIWMAGAAAVAISPLSVPEEVSALVAATGCRVAVALDVLSAPALERPLSARNRRLIKPSAARPAAPLATAALLVRPATAVFPQRPADGKAAVLWLNDERTWPRSDPDFVSCPRPTVAR